MNDHIPVLIPVTLLVAALIIPLAGIRGKGWAHTVAFAGVLLSLALAVEGMWLVLATGTMRYALGGWTPPIGIELVLDPLSAFMTVLILAVGTLVLLHARTSVAGELPHKSVPFFSLCLLLLTGFVGIVLTGDLFNLFVFLEIGSLAGYGLAAIGDRRAPVAAFRYLLLGTVGATFYLLGVGLVFMMTGSLNMADLTTLLPFSTSEPPVMVGFVLMAMGISLKMALFPLHLWLPDTYTFASSPSSALLAPLGTKVAAYVLIRLMVFVFEPGFSRDQLFVSDAMVWMALAGIVFGSVLAVAQTELKRMLAYSSVAQIGYIALGVGLGSALGLVGALLHILNHAVMKGALFLVAGNLRLKLGHTELFKLDDRLRTTMPWSMAAFVVAALSMVGIPPLAGFFSKWYLVLASIEQDAWAAVAVILVGSLLSAAYFFRILERVYLRPQGDSTGDTVAVEPAGGSAEVRWPMLAPTLILSVSLLVLGILNTVIVDGVLVRIVPNTLEGGQ